jgi:membrane-associated PAP2 superfamily phosphatase
MPNANVPMRPTGGRPRRNPAALDAGVAALVLIALLAWELGGLDLPLTRLATADHAFAWRDHWLTSTVAHSGGRALAWVAAIALVAYAAWPISANAHRSPSRRERLACLLAVLASLVLVPAMKRLSLTSCPWDLAEFGGVAAYVAHWRIGFTDGGPGHCFPSGHAVAAFAFLGLHHLWRPHRPRQAT